MHKQTQMHPMGVEPTISPSTLNLQEEKMPFELELIGITGANIGGGQGLSWSIYCTQRFHKEYPGHYTDSKFNNISKHIHT